MLITDLQKLQQTLDGTVRGTYHYSHIYSPCAAGAINFLKQIRATRSYMLRADEVIHLIKQIEQEITKVGQQEQASIERSMQAAAWQQ